MTKKVSIITPCFNGEQFLDRYFNSILVQTYKALEVIFVDDGSTDKTRQKCNEYRKKLDVAGIDFKYIYKENGGPASAINKGLKLFTGEYVTWPDCDDWLMPESIEERVRFLEENSEYGGVRTDGFMVQEDKINQLKQRFSDYFELNKDTIFKDMVFSRTYCTCGGYMFRSRILKECIPSVKINENLHGQNWQLMLPLCYKYKVGYIDQPLFAYLVRKNSLSHQSVYQGYDEKIRLINEYEKTVTTVLKQMEDLNASELVQLLEKLKVMYKHQRLLLDVRFDKPLESSNDIFAKKLIIWGTGNASKQVIRILNRTSLSNNIQYLVDNDSKKWGEMFEGFIVNSPDELIKNEKENVLIVVVSSYYSYIRKQLLQYGYLEWEDFIEGMSFLL